MRNGKQVVSIIFSSWMAQSGERLTIFFRSIDVANGKFEATVPAYGSLAIHSGALLESDDPGGAYDEYTVDN